MEAFTRDDGSVLRVVPGFRARVLGYRQSVTPRPAWTAEEFTAAAQKQRRRFERLLAGIARWRRGGLDRAEVLDVGCGGGINCLLASLEPVRRVVGIDLQPQLLNGDASSDPVRRLAQTVLEQRTGRNGTTLSDAMARLPLTMHAMDARRMSFPDASFDLLLSRSAMEHLMPIEQALEEMARVVRPGGLVHHGIDPFYWLRGCHKRGVVDIPWAHARLTLPEYERFVTEYEGPSKAAQRAHRLRTLNALTAAQWRDVVEAGPFEVLEWKLEVSEFARETLREHPDVHETLLPGVSADELVYGRIEAWLRRK